MASSRHLSEAIFIQKVLFPLKVEKFIVVGKPIPPSIILSLEAFTVRKADTLSVIGAL